MHALMHSCKPTNYLNETFGAHIRLVLFQMHLGHLHPTGQVGLRKATNTEKKGHRYNQHTPTILWYLPTHCNPEGSAAGSQGTHDAGGGAAADATW